jgi:hypothetical protein
MIGPEPFVWITLGLGVCISLYIGFKSKRPMSWAFFFLAIFWGFVIGVCMSIIFGFAYEICQVYFKRCPRLTKDIYFARFVPFVLFPLYTAAIIFFKLAQPSNKDL